MEKSIYFEYLDNLRESGITTMFGAPCFLQEEFDLNQENTKSITVEWMRTFLERNLR